MVVFHHALATGQRIDDRVDAAGEKPLDPFCILLRRPNQAELVQELIGNKLSGAIEVTLFPRHLDPACVLAEAADVGDVQVVLRGAVERDAPAGGKDGRFVFRIDACHQQGRDLHIGRIPTRGLGSFRDQSAVLA